MFWFEQHRIAFQREGSQLLAALLGLSLRSYCALARVDAGDIKWNTGGYGTKSYPRGVLLTLWITT